MRLCFGTFSNILLENRSNNAVDKALVGTTLVSFIKPTFTYDLSYIYKIMDRKRNLVADLVEVELDIKDLRIKFQKYAIECLTPSRNHIFIAFFNLILSDEALEHSTKADLIMKTQLQGIHFPQFLAEIFYFVVKYTNNKLIDPELPAISPEPEDEDRDLYKKMALCAIENENLDILNFALEKQDNNIYIERILSALNKNNVCITQQPFVDLFHRCFSKITNNIYRSRAFENCLTTGYFKDKPDELLEMHFHEFTNQVYVCETLEFMYKNELSDLADQYRNKLTNRRYIERLEQFLADC